MIHCPGDARFKNTPGHAWAYDSYSKPNGLGGESYPNNTYWGSGATYTKLSEISAAALTFAFREDVDSRGYNEGTWVVNWNLAAPMFGHAQSFTWEDPIPMYHGNVSTAGFVDGHAEYHKWVDGALIAYGKSVANGGSFSPPQTRAGPDYDYVYNGYRFPGWKP